MVLDGGLVVVNFEEAVCVYEGDFDAREKTDEGFDGAIEIAYVPGKGHITSQREVSVEYLAPAIPTVGQGATGFEEGCKETHAALKYSNFDLKFGDLYEESV